MVKQTKIIKEILGSPDQDGYYNGAYIFSDGTAEFVCGYANPKGKRLLSEEYHNITLATPQQVYTRYGQPQQS